MLAVIGLFVICILISILSFISSRSIKDAITGLTTSSIISLLIVSIFMIISYDGYIDLKQKRVIICQYAESINLYSKLAIPDKNNISSSEITDLKYQNYQESIKELIQDLRRQVVNYNTILIGKRELNNNIVFNWLIIAPDRNMETIKIEDVISIK